MKITAYWMLLVFIRNLQVNCVTQMKKLNLFSVIFLLLAWQLTWNNNKKVANRIVLIGWNFINLTALKRNATL